MPKETVQPQALTQAAIEGLKSVVDRLEKNGEERAQVADDRKAIMADAKSKGYDPKAINAVLKVRKADKQKLAEEEQVKDLYLHALGELSEESALAR